MLIESCGWNDLIVPHRCSVPSWPISTILPPCFGSTRNDLAGFLPIFIDIERLSKGHQLPISFTNTLNAFCWLQGTSIVFMIGSSIISSCYFSCVSPFQRHKQTGHLTRNSPDTAAAHTTLRA